MSKRYRDAAAIQAGACNPIAIVNALKNAIDECRAADQGTDTINSDPAIQAIVHQLAHLTGVQYMDQSGYEHMMRRVEAGKAIEVKAQNEANQQPVFGKKEPRPAIGTKPVPVVISDGGGMACWDGQPMRCPKRGEFYLSGGIVEAYRAPNDLTTPYWIALKVQA